MSEAAKLQEPPLNLDHRVGQLRKLIAVREKIEEDHKKQLEPYKLAEAKLRAWLMTWLREHGLKTFNTNHNGSITWVDSVTFRIEDQEAFKEFVISNEAWEYADWRANATACKDYIEEHRDPSDPDALNVPPGVKPNPNPYLRVNPPKARTPKAKKMEFVDETEEGNH